MTAGLRLESFSARSDAVLPPPITPADLAAARLQGLADGRAAAADEAAAAVAAALRALADALARDAAERRTRAAETRREIAVLLRSVIARIAPRLRADALAERVVLELTGRAAAAPAEACRIRCEAGLVAPLRQALSEAGIAGVEVVAGTGPLEVAVPGGALRIDMAAFEAELDRLVGAFTEGED